MSPDGGIESCAARHDRIDVIEDLARHTAADVSELRHDFSAMTSRVEGLAHAHQATLVAVRASTEASGRLSATLDRVDTRLDALIGDYGAHKVADERGKRDLPHLALWLWVSSLSAGAFFIAWAATNWSAIIHFLPPGRPG